MTRTKDGLPRRAVTLLGCAGGAHRFHTPGMRALRSLAHSKIVSANCTSYLVRDPNRVKAFGPASLAFTLFFLRLSKPKIVATSTRSGTPWESLNPRISTQFSPRPRSC